MFTTKLSLATKCSKIRVIRGSLRLRLKTTSHYKYSSLKHVSYRKIPSLSIKNDLGYRNDRPVLVFYTCISMRFLL